MSDIAPYSSTRSHIFMLLLLTLAMVLPGLASLPVIDRDEARYVQASIQMVQTGDVMNIRFQDQARNKKPAGVYWLQSAALKVFSNPDKRQIWVHRLPSVLGALLAIFATYWGGAKLIGRDTAFVSAALLAASLLFVFEAHIAKTDAILCGLSACVFAALGHLRHGTPASSRLPVWVFWIALGGSMMIKGPILLAILALTFIGFWLWNRELSWARPLLKPLPIFTFLLIWLPWAIGIYIVTDGAFFKESLGQDLGGKLISSQEKHPGPPGYHAALIWIMMWPASLFLLPAIANGIRIFRAEKKQINASSEFKTLQLCVLWILPFWVIIELMPTKLPHYSLPLYPAFCLMIGASLSEVSHIRAFKRLRIANNVLFLLASAMLFSALIYISFEHGQIAQKTTSLVIGAFASVAGLYAIFNITRGQIKPAFYSVICAAMIISIGGYKLLLPELETFNTSARIAQALDERLPRLQDTTLLSPSYTEPSLVYHLGTNIELGLKTNPLDVSALKSGRILLIDSLSGTQENLFNNIQTLAQDNHICLDISEPISGFNYSKGDAVNIHIIQKKPCS
ncbi:MAG: glycosyltransferase family 39 protein [Litorimonas sp.]